MDLVFWLTAGYLALSGMVVAIATFVLYRALRGVTRLVFGPEPVFGSDARTRVIAFGVAALAFPSVVPWAVYLSVWVFIALFSDFPRWWVTNWQRAVQVCNDGTAQLSHCLGQAGFGFVQALGSGLSDGYRTLGLNDFPFRDTIFLVTLWAVLAQFFSTVGTADADGEPRFRLQAAYARLSAAGRQNFHFFVVLALAGYLSIAAIAAIPSLQETAEPVAALSGDELKKALADAPRVIDVKQLEAEDPFKALDDWLRENPVRPASAAATPSPEAVPDSSQQNAGDVPPGNTSGTPARQAAVTVAAVTAPIPSAVEISRSSVVQLQRELKQRRRELLQLLGELQRSNTEQADRTRTSAFTVYSVSNVERKGSRERSQHFQNIVDWYREGIATLDSAAADCQQGILRADAYWTDWSGSYRGFLQNASSQLDPYSRSVLDVGLERVYGEARVACQAVRVNRVVPPRPALGSYLGPFGLVASWLVRTESLPLALIVGLLGFGLLGSSCSTFVREKATKTDRGGALIQDLPSVVIRGLSAAVVVFLAVEGGLAIFSTSTPEPNPYVLLFTCLVAAVFSEDVWEWAHRKLRESFGGNAGSGGAPSAGSGAASASGGPPVQSQNVTP